MSTENSSNSKKATIFMILSIVLAIACCILTWQLINVKETVRIEKITKDSLIVDNSGLLQKLKNLDSEYSDLIGEYDNLDSLFTTEKDKVKNLIAEIKSAKGTNKNYQKKVDELEARLKDYVAQIEELKAKNQALTAENIKVKTSLDSSNTENSKLSSNNEDLNKKVEAGSVLKAYEVFSDAIKVKSGKEIPTKRSKKVDKIRTCFVLSENAIATKGEKTIYLRIAGPDGVILTKGTDDSYSFKYEGKDIIYSVKSTTNYNGKAMDICMYWEKTKDFKKGNYSAELFLDGYPIGSSSFTLE
jgi:predicted nuclease with TOPRIM domain